MEKQENMRKLIKEVKKMAGIDKCPMCQCFYDVMMEMKEALEKGLSFHEPWVPIR